MFVPSHKIRHGFLLFILAFFAAAMNVSAQQPLATPREYAVTRVTDGDTLVATDGNIFFKVRIAGLDAPEMAQPYGKVAKTALFQLVSEKKIQIKTVGRGLDSYGRVLGIVTVGETDVAKKLIAQGLATYYRPRCRDYPADQDKYNYDPRPYIASETKAREQKLQFWSQRDPMLPCQFRRLK